LHNFRSVSGASFEKLIFLLLKDGISFKIITIVFVMMLFTLSWFAILASVALQDLEDPNMSKV